MRDLTKIATCSYCGTRSVLTLGGRVQHELTCSSCGAKLHTMKPLRIDDRPQKGAAKPHRPTPAPRPARKPKRRRGWADFLEDAFDVIEDIFD